MDIILKHSFRSAAASVILLFTALVAHGDVLLDEKWTDGSRGETDRPKEAAVWIGREADVSVDDGALTTKMGPTSQKIWTYFTDQDPVTLEVGQKLAATVSFIPHGKLSQTTSRSLRIGLFHDPTDPRVEADVNSDAGGSGAPGAMPAAMPCKCSSPATSTRPPSRSISASGSI